MATFQETQVFFRPNASVPFFEEFSPENKSLNEAFSALEAAAPGFVLKQDTENATRRLVVVKTFWKSKAARDAFQKANAAAISAFFAVRAEYYDANGLVFETDYTAP